jgi:hypothetical protein
MCGVLVVLLVDLISGRVDQFKDIRHQGSGSRKQVNPDIWNVPGMQSALKSERSTKQLSVASLCRLRKMSDD